tara:strand:- start:9545 stop:9982 length:438 start_codon:yes stop_codon:yes gene_type:complete
MKLPLFAKSFAVLFFACLATASAQDVKIGVLDFSGPSASGFRASLTTELAALGLTIVDSATVDSAAAGKSLMKGAAVDSGVAVQIGQASGATVLVAGKALGPLNVAQIISTSNATVVGATGNNAKGLAAAIKSTIETNSSALLTK